jgi:hypothetical protein
LVRQSGAASVDVADDRISTANTAIRKVNFNPRDWRGDSMKGARFPSARRISSICWRRARLLRAQG